MKFMIACFALVAVASAATYNPHLGKPQYVNNEGSVPILRSESVVEPDGSYRYGYETGNGITADESGVGGQRAQGSAAWTAPDGTPIQFSYVADENGYQPVGAHIPATPPHVLRLLEWIATHPEQSEDRPIHSHAQVHVPQVRYTPKVYAPKPQALTGFPVYRHQ